MGEFHPIQNEAIAVLRSESRVASGLRALEQQGVNFTEVVGDYKVVSSQYCILHIAYIITFFICYIE